MAHNTKPYGQPYAARSLWRRQGKADQSDQAEYTRVSDHAGVMRLQRTPRYSCSPPALRPKPVNKLGFFDAAVHVMTVMAAAAINTVCPMRLAAKNV